MSWYVREEVTIADLSTLANGWKGRVALITDSVCAGRSPGIVASARWLLGCVYGSDMKAVEALYRFAVRDIQERVKDGSVL